MKKTIRIFALGGNEVSPVGLKDKDGKPLNPDIPMQWRRTAKTLKNIADIFEKHPQDYYVITHGNGPQVGNVLLSSEYTRKFLFPIPLDVCVADTQGSMAYMIAQLNNELNIRGIDNIVSGIVTQVVVDPNDPDFKNPSKYIGPSYTRQEAQERMEKDGWVMKVYKRDESGNEMWRRVVPSPKPIDIVEIDTIEALIEKGIIPITVGGGGIPVKEVVPEIKDGFEIYRCSYGIEYKRPYKADQKFLKMYSGVEAVIDKDLASALLGSLLIKRAKARGQHLDVMLTIFTGEDGIKIDYQKPTQKDIRVIRVSELEEIYNSMPDQFPAGSMGPKIKACIEFMKNGGTKAFITKTELFEQTLEGKAGTTIIP
ncbi:MAG: carbamate kinase [Elusimicrobiales bacterium]